MQRLSKTLQQGGAASRRGAEQIIFEGKVKVNGVTIIKPEHHVSSEDIITVNNRRLRRSQSKHYYLLNKPTGYLCCNLRKGKERLVLDLFSGVKERLFTVGRLDKETSGLIIVTNDGEFANRIMHPRFGVEKEYLVKTNIEITGLHLQTISKGTTVEGVHVKPKRVCKVRKGTLKIVVGEGRKREVRRLVEDAGLEVVELTRIRIGALSLGRLPVGTWKEMNKKEIELVCNI